MRYYVTSDTHGFYTALETALKTAGFFEDTQPHKLLIIGDLFDRGDEALRLQEFILEQMEKDLVILIKGNHEDMFEQLVTEDKGLPYGVHVHNGTYDTALQLTGFDRVIAEIRHYDFAEAAMRTPYYQKIIPAMLDYYETRNYVFTHGWLPCYPTRSGSYARIEDWRHALKDSWKRSRWYNGMDAFRTAYDEKTVVCGHWHASYGHSRYEHKGSEFGEDADFTPFMASGIIALDACTAHTGFVNCMIIDDEELPQPETAHAQGET